MSQTDIIAHRLLLIAVLLGIIIAVLASQKPRTVAKNEDTIAAVNGVLIAKLAADANRDGSITDAELQQAIDQQLLVQEAQRTDLIADDMIAQQALEARLLVRQAQLFALLPVAEEELQNYYELNKDKFAAAQALHIELLYLPLAAAEARQTEEEEALSLLDTVRAALKGGMDFSTAQKQYGPTTTFNLPRRLVLVERLKGLMPLGLLQVAVQLQAGTITDAFRFGEGWYFLNIAERQNMPTPSYDDVADQVRNILEQKALRQTRARLLANLRDRATILSFGN
jgi:hypothetical protein